MPRHPSIDEVMRYRTSSTRRAGNETYAAMALAAATLVALVWANVSEGYSSFWSTVASLRVGSFAIELTLAQWVDEGLMTLFFLAVGLDVRRELALGELQHPSRAALPVAAAVGGLLVPTAIFLLLAGGKPMPRPGGPSFPLIRRLQLGCWHSSGRATHPACGCSC